MQRSILLAIILIVGFNLQSQSTFKTDYFWLNPAMGSNSITGKTMSLSFFAQIDKHMLGVAFHVNNEELNSPFISKHPDIFLHDISFQYGRRWKEHYGFVAISGGIGLVAGKKRGELDRSVNHLRSQTLYEIYEIDQISTVGFPIQAQIQVTPIKWVGIGLTAVGNLNSELPYGALMLSATFGKINDAGAFW